MDTLKYGLVYGTKWTMSSASVYYQDVQGRDTAVNQYSVNVSNGKYSLQTKYRYVRNTTGDCIRFETLRFDFVLGDWAVISADDYEVNGAVKRENILIDSDSYVAGLFENTLTRNTVSKTQSGTLSPQTRSTYYYDSALPNGLKPMNSQDLKIYPNPSTSQIHLNIDEFPTAKTWILHDLHGKKYISQTITGNAEMDVISLSSGLYVLKLLDANGRALGMAKFIKE